ncbi:hypothetical protein PR048_023014 [Dryococelus australis]|uniref:GAG-pre-integrase domain-containing protein n=1 Tax=Dryococelus australis TaxID=614101 RepID=A0ABQ9GSY8_9NEOP|nr:hypothetical protein PR048_023014 [Dryococelus australis]
MSCDSAKGMFDKLCSTYGRDSSHNKKFQLQKTMMGKILSSLPDRSRHFLTTSESTSKSDRTLTNLTDRLLVEEERGHISSTHDNLAFKTVYKNLGHIAQNCMKKKLGCKICKKDNHKEKNCYFGDRNKKSTTSNRDKVVFLTGSMGGKPEGSWKNENVCRAQRGYRVPRMCIEKCAVGSRFNKKSDIGIQNYRKWRTKITGEDNAGLYNINLNCSETTLLSESKQTSDLNLWQRRIGHLNVVSMNKLATISSGLEELKF